MREQNLDTNSRTQRAIDYLKAEVLPDGRYAWERFDGWVAGGLETMEHAAFGSHPFAPKPKLLPPEETAGYGF